MKKSLVLLIFILLNLCHQGQGATSPVVKTDNARVSLISGVDQFTPGEAFAIGFRIQHREGWHTYWEHPGDTGLAPVLTWDLPEGWEVSEIEWPTPSFYLSEGIASHIYTGDLILPMQVLPPTTYEGEAVTLNLKAEWLICEVICLPEDASLSLRLPKAAEGQAEEVPPEAALIRDAQTKLPAADAPEGVQWEIKPEGDYQIRFPTALGIKPGDNWHFFSQDGTIEPSAPQIWEEADDGDWLLHLVASPYPPEAGSAIKGVMATPGLPWEELSGKEAFTLERIPRKAALPGVSPAAGSGLTFPLALGMAFLGGLILNLMPCVFPVLSLKILGFVQQADQESQKGAWKGGISFAAGVILSFLVLAAILVALRQAGEELGWGFQLQEPWFVAALAVLMFAIGLNLSGLFELGTSLTRLGNVSSSGHRGHFLSGILATAVATPCTAPFMGAAMGYALTLAPLATLVIFLFLSLGLATPYVLLSIFPQWLKVLPRPGAWMETFKQLVAFPIYATVIWLLWVFGRQTGFESLAVMMVSLLLAAIGFWVFGRWCRPVRSKITRRTAGAVALLLILLSFFGVRLSLTMENFPTAATSGTPDESGEGGLAWEPFSDKVLQDYLAAGKTVYVDFTASWCLTCQVNKRVYRSEELQNAFSAGDIVTLKADWTQRDPEITRELERLGRSGVPVNAFYQSGAEPKVLNEILTVDHVLENLP